MLLSRVRKVSVWRLALASVLVLPLLYVAWGLFTYGLLIEVLGGKMGLFGAETLYGRNMREVTIALQVVATLAFGRVAVRLVRSAYSKL